MAQVLVAARAIDVDQQRYRCGAFQVEITDLMNEKQANVFPLHLAPIDRFFLVDENSAYPMTYVIQIECQGVLDREAFEAALRQAMDRHILLKAVIRPAKRGMLCWVSSDGMFPPIDWNTDDVPVQCEECRSTRGGQDEIAARDFQHGTAPCRSAMKLPGDPDPARSP